VDHEVRAPALVVVLLVDVDELDAGLVEADVLADLGRDGGDHLLGRAEARAAQAEVAQEVARGAPAAQHVAEVALHVVEQLVPVLGRAEVLAEEHR
jgi:hypothetical protein